MTLQGGSTKAITLGILLTLASQVFQAVRLVMEELLLKKMELHPMEVTLSLQNSFWACAHSDFSQYV